MHPYSPERYARNKVLRQLSPSDGPHWMIYADNRAYVWTGAIHWNGKERDPNEGYSGDRILGAKIRDCAKNVDTLPDRIGAWVKLLNVDQPGYDPGDSQVFEQKWAQESTYTRWAHYGALYGYNYHCGAANQSLLGAADVAAFPGNLFRASAVMDKRVHFVETRKAPSLPSAPRIRISRLAESLRK
jgi:hypothetical protein